MRQPTHTLPGERVPAVAYEFAVGFRRGLVLTVCCRGRAGACRKWAAWVARLADPRWAELEAVGPLETVRSVVIG